MTVSAGNGLRSGSCAPMGRLLELTSRAEARAFARLHDGWRSRCPLCAKLFRYSSNSDVTPPALMEPGRPAQQGNEYDCCGTANLWVFAPLEGWRHVKVTERRTIVDFAHVLRDLSDRARRPQQT